MRIWLGGSMASSNEVTRENIDSIESETLEFVNKTISSIETLIADLRKAKNKSELEEKAAHFFDVYRALLDWKEEFDSREANEGFAPRVARLQDLADICQAYE
jgi:hypothetical protein